MPSFPVGSVTVISKASKRLQPLCADEIVPEFTGFIQNTESPFCNETLKFAFDGSLVKMVSTAFSPTTGLPPGNKGKGLKAKE